MRCSACAARGHCWLGGGAFLLSLPSNLSPTLCPLPPPFDVFGVFLLPLPRSLFAVGGCCWASASVGSATSSARRRATARMPLVQDGRFDIAQTVGVGGGDRGADHRALLVVIPWPAAMKHGAVVPHHDVAGPPLVDVDIFPLGRLIHQLGEKLPGIAVVHAVDRIG